MIKWWRCPHCGKKERQDRATEVIHIHTVNGKTKDVYLKRIDDEP